MSRLDSPFVGRSAEQTTLKFALGRAERGERRVVTLRGEPGVGKTWLAQRFADDAAANGVAVHRARVWEWGGAPALFPWSQLIRDLASQTADDHPCAPRLDDLLERLSSGDGASSASPQARFVLFDDIADVLSQLCREQTRVLTIDDVHAADASSLHLLRFISRDTRPARLLVVCTCRNVEMRCSEDVRELLDELERDVERVDVGGLAVRDVAALISSITGGAAGDDAAHRVREATGGNPLYVDGLVRAALSTGSLDGLANGEGGLPSDLRATLERRLSGFSEDGARILGAAALLGRPTNVSLLAKITDLAETSVIAVLRHATREQVMRELPDGVCYAFVHSLLEEAAARRISPEEQMTLHRAIADALSTASELAPASELARHFLAAGPGDARSLGIGYALEAGDQSMRVFAYEDAADAYERARAALALEAAPDLDLLARCSLGVGHAHRMSGRPNLARPQFRHVTKLDVSPERFAEAALGMAQMSEFAIPDREAIALLEESWERLPEGEVALRTRVRTRQVMERWSDRVPEECDAWSLEALALARAGEDPRLYVAAIVARMTACWGPSGIAVRRRLLPELERAARATGDRSLLVEVERWRMNVGWDLGDTTAVATALDRYERLAEELRSPQLRLNAALRRTTVAEIAGDLEALDRHTDAMEEAGAAAADPQLSFYVTISRGHAAWERGDVDAYRAASEFILSQELLASNVLPVTAGFVSHSISCAQGAEEARAVFERAAADLAESVPDSFGALSGLCFLAEVAYRLEARDAAGPLADRLRAHADLFGVAGLAVSRGSAHRYLGLLESMLGNDDDADTHFALGVEANLRAGARGFAAYTLADHGEVLRARGTDDARREAQHLEAQALALCRELGFRHLEGVLEARVSSPLVDRVVFFATDDTYVVQSGERRVRYKSSRGLDYLALLLRSPAEEIHAATLASGGHHPEGPRGDAGGVIDRAAASSYRERLEGIAAAVASAERAGDGERVSELRAEAAFIAKELGSALGRGGKIRKVADVSERARSAVTRAVRRAIERLDDDLPRVAAHLRTAVRTGTFCSYVPSGDLLCELDELELDEV